MTKFQDFLELYLKLDVLQLTDVFKGFRNTCKKIFELGSLSLPVFSWSAAFKTSGVFLNLLCKEDMYIFFEQGICGGYSAIHKRYSKANNKYMKDYDPNEPLFG